VFGIDIVTTGHDALPANGIGKVLRAKLGLYSSLLEAKMLGHRPPVSVAWLSEIAESQGVPLVSVSSPVDLGRVRVAERQREAIERILRSGQIVAAYARPLSIRGEEAYGWWRIDPASGEILGLLEGAEGGAFQAGGENLSLKATITIGAVTGALGSYLICWLQEGISASACIWAAGCGGIVGGVFSAAVYGLLAGHAVVTSLGGIFEAGTIGSGTGAVLGGAGSVILDQIINVCQGRPPTHDPNDNDLDGETNDRDANDDCPSCDPDNPPPDNPNDTEDVDDDNDGVADDDDPFPSNSRESRDTDGDGIGDNADPHPTVPSSEDRDGDGVRNNEDAFPDDASEHRDTDRNGVGDNHEMLYREDADGDGVPEGVGGDAFPQDPTESRDSDRDGVGDNRDKDPRDPAVTADADNDGIDDQHDLDPTREGPWMPAEDDSFDESPQPQWTRPPWARR
jgi:hypothetical protein